MKQRKTLFLVLLLAVVAGSPLFADELQSFIDEYLTFMGQMENTLSGFRDAYNASQDDDARLAAFETFVVSMSEVMAAGQALGERESELGDIVPDEPPQEVVEAMDRVEALQPELSPIFGEIMEKAGTDERFANLLVQLQNATP